MCSSRNSLLDEIDKTMKIHFETMREPSVPAGTSWCYRRIRGYRPADPKCSMLSLAVQAGPLDYVKYKTKGGPKNIKAADCSLIDYALSDDIAKVYETVEYLLTHGSPSKSEISRAWGIGLQNYFDRGYDKSSRTSLRYKSGLITTLKWIQVFILLVNQGADAKIAVTWSAGRHVGAWGQISACALFEPREEAFDPEDVRREVIKEFPDMGSNEDFKRKGWVQYKRVWIELEDAKEVLYNMLVERGGGSWNDISYA